ncbi:ER membrane protein complex subunit 8/9 homolog [Plodia interpunctella]|uniref:ER membrane protein complex subunit 8/9 homolog n=1 Tax=Plodia interpunctella TaxID=58824 RepID=UPI00236813BA|nr:ER membrane protein complex subunit 8/9 homolog [Plodia interpunctella]
MGEVSLETAAYAKIILHAAKYPDSAVTGVLLADASKLKDGAKNQDLDIVDAIPLFHHSHYVSPMGEVALTQIEALASNENRIVAGYYAACENYRDNTVEKCPGQKIAEKIAEYFPSAVFVVVDNMKLSKNLEESALNLYKYTDGKWRLRESNKVTFPTPYTLETVSHLLQKRVQKDLVDFDNYLDDCTQDWTNLGIEKLVASINASNMIDCKDD